MTAVASRGLMGIGDVLAALRPDFPDVTISKIRFLESEGLVLPERTSSGYRKFSHADVERLRYVLGCQRDQYLPLKVIRDHLEAIDRGLEPPTGLEGPRVPRAPYQQQYDRDDHDARSDQRVAHAATPLSALGRQRSGRRFPGVPAPDGTESSRA